MQISKNLNQPNFTAVFVDDNRTNRYSSTEHRLTLKLTGKDIKKFPEGHTKGEITLQTYGSHDDVDIYQLRMGKKNVFSIMHGEKKFNKSYFKKMKVLLESIKSKHPMIENLRNFWINTLLKNTEENAKRFIKIK